MPELTIGSGSEERQTIPYRIESSDKPVNHAVVIHIQPSESSESQTVELVPVEATCRSQTFRGYVMDGAKRFPVYAYRHDTFLDIWLDGKTTRLRLESPDARLRQRKAHGDGHADTTVTAPMPGSILSVKASVGDTVDKNQPLVVMESMKMELTLGAPCRGIVRLLSASPGQQVNLGDLLAELEPQTDA
jgi:biotin carboxyl carrier protein